MTFWDHFDVLRGNILRSIAVVFGLSIFGFCFKSFLFETIILAPTNSDFITYKLLAWDFEMKLISIEMSAQFFVHLRAAFSLGLVLGFPYIIFEIWRFIVPALYEKEKRAFRAAFSLSSVLFYFGVLVGFFIVLPVCLQFFVNYQVSTSVENTISLSSYMSMFNTMVILLGLVFEFPVVILALSRLGIVGKSFLKKGRKYAAIIILILAALITPSDPFSMLVLSLPLYLLYELTIILCK